MNDGRLTHQERLAIVYQRLTALPPATGPDEALRQLADTLDSVEDEHSGVPRNPNPGLKPDGRMYPPRADFIHREEDGTLVALTRGNTIYAEPDGSLRITDRHTGETVYQRPGA
ncbi:hypothetical protein ACIQGZ_17345 [Streptomyces sp. NPDC092296]|uniref:hypothetical protein n=1 Tax=Streptomyces sp. NPDC092296 TaxID=3366012 RepID=UPI003804FEAC